MPLGALFALAVYGSSLPQAPQDGQQIQGASQRPPEVVAPVSADERVADYTEALAWFTAILALLGGTQGYLLLRQVRLARDEFNATHRPRIRVRRMAFDGYGYGPDALGIAFISVVNVGDGRATITGVTGRFYLRSQDGKWPWGRPAFDKFGIPPQTKIVPGQLVTWIATDGRVITVDEYGALIDGEYQLWLIGEIRYRDNADITRQTGFAWACDRHTKEFFRQRSEESYDYED